MAKLVSSSIRAEIGALQRKVRSLFDGFRAKIHQSSNRVAILEQQHGPDETIKIFDMAKGLIDSRGASSIKLQKFIHLLENRTRHTRKASSRFSLPWAASLDN